MSKVGWGESQAEEAGGAQSSTVLAKRGKLSLYEIKTGSSGRS